MPGRAGGRRACASAPIPLASTNDIAKLGSEAPIPPLAGWSRASPSATRTRAPASVRSTRRARSRRARPPIIPAATRPLEDLRPACSGARRQPVREQHAEKRHEVRAEQQKELLVLREVDAERDRGRERRRPRRSATAAMRAARILQRHRRRIDVRERFVGLVDRQREQREHRARRRLRPPSSGRPSARRSTDARARARRRSRTGTASAGDSRHRTEERRPRIPGEARVVRDEGHPRDRQRDHEVDAEPEEPPPPPLVPQLVQIGRARTIQTAR